jgi:hypothetical protein
MTLYGRTRGLVVIAVALALAACATAGGKSAPVPISSVGALAGKWWGTLNIGGGDTPCTLTLAPNGAAQLVGMTATFNGTVTAKDGKGEYTFPGRSDGSVTLYRLEGGKLQLHLDGRSGQFQAWVTKE